jgi:hypothetical protein
MNLKPECFSPDFATAPSPPPTGMVWLRLAALLVTLCPPLICQTISATQSPVAVLPQSSYLVPNFPSSVTGLLFRYGNRLQQPGNERLTLTGTYTSASGVSANAAVITEITGNARIQLTGGVAKVVVSNNLQVTSNGATASGSDQSLLQSVEADAPETFFYSWSHGEAVRLLGSRFRTDDGKAAIYTGPWFDIYEVVSKSGGNQTQRKLFYVDSDLRQVVQARYQIQQGGSTVNVATIFSGWSQVNGQLVPGRIERFENGQSVFVIAVTSGQTGPALADGAFSATAQ